MIYTQQRRVNPLEDSSRVGGGGHKRARRASVIQLQFTLMGSHIDVRLDALTGIPSRQPEDSALAGAAGRTFYIETFGCQMNVHDSEKVAGVLLKRGYRQVDSPEAAQLVFFNTCSIREKAAQKVFTRLGQVRPGQDAGKVIGVLGCVAQQEGQKIFERAPWVSLVCGSASYRRLPDLLAELEAGNRRMVGLATDTDETFETEITRRDNPFRAYLTIIEGCDRSCTYCVVPFTRGPERSRSSISVLREVRQLADVGYSEIQLLGQTVNSYKDPSPRRLNFAELLVGVADVPGIRRVRFATSHPRDFHADIVQAIEAVPALCDHIHLPVQSGSSRVLRAMNRTYNRAQYFEKIALIRSARRAISMTTDIIVGFPGEAEADFEETLILLDLESHPPAAGIDRVTVTIAPAPGPVTQFSLIEHPRPSPEQLSTLLARLAALAGEDRVGAPALADTYRPGAFGYEKKVAERLEWWERRKAEGEGQGETGQGGQGAGEGAGESS